MSANTFRILTRWTIEASIEEIAAVLNDPLSLPTWWGEVYLGTAISHGGDASGIGRQVKIHSKGWLPYHLNWTATLVESRAPHGWTIDASGDLEGQGVWTLTQQGGTAIVDYDWQVKAERPILKALSPLLGPLFGWNHKWAMAKGEAGLRREIARRRAAQNTV